MCRNASQSKSVAIGKPKPFSESIPEPFTIT
jgi:hypothetical protein